MRHFEWSKISNRQQGDTYDKERSETSSRQGDTFTSEWSKVSNRLQGDTYYIGIVS